LAIGIDQDVGRFEIAVNHAALVTIFHRVTDFLDQLSRVPRGQRATGDAVGKTLAVHVAHREIVLTLVLANLKDRHNAWVI
jgi:hypothetical protein